MTVYKVKHTDSSKADIEIHEEEVNTSSDVTLFGRKRLGYGQEMNANLLHILENFACPELSSDAAGAWPNTGAASKKGDGVTALLSNPKQGQAWFNKTKGMLYAYNGSTWVPMLKAGAIAASWGTLAHGGTIPLPVASNGTTFTREECSWVVSPLSYPGVIDYINCSADQSGVVTMQYSFPDNAALVSGLVNYMIVGIKGNDSTGINETPTEMFPTPSVTPTNSVTPTPAESVTPTPTSSEATPTPSPSSGADPTPTPSPTPTISVTPSASPAPPTPTPSPSPSNLPSGAYITSQYIISDDALPGTGKAGYRLNANGNAESNHQNGYTVIAPWLTSGIASEYEARATLTGGNPPSLGGTLGTWQSLATSRTWRTEGPYPEPEICQMLIEIRQASSGIVITSATITLQVSTTEEPG